MDRYLLARDRGHLIRFPGVGKRRQFRELGAEGCLLERSPYIYAWKQRIR